MWLAPAAQLLAVVAALPQAGTAGLTPPEPIVTRQSVFAIPFRIDRPPQASQEPVELQLFVSGDRGASWQLYGKVQPARKHFMFRAAADGEYWFDVRTLDRMGQLRPKRSHAPGLRVVVDTALPKLQLRAQRGNAGQITASWQIDEPHRKPNGFSLHYRSGPEGQWQPVAVRRDDSLGAAPSGTGVLGAGAVKTGEVSWWPPDGSRSIEVRAEATDAAGNLAVSQVTVPAANTGQPPSQTLSTDANSWQPEGTADQPSTVWPADAIAGNPTTRNPTAGPQTDYQSDYQNPGGQSSGDPGAGTAGTGPPYGRTPSEYGNDGSTYGNTRSESPDYGRSWSDPSAGSVATNVHPPVRNQYSLVGQSSAGGRPDDNLPPGARLRMVNSRVFELEHDVPSVGPSAMARAELWGTRDGGQNWTRYPVDDETRNPLLVSVYEEGIYGFRVVSNSGAGAVSRPPARGDLPEVWVGVDVTKPTARILSAQRGSGSQHNSLTISWEAKDLRLAQRPISLFVRNGPYGSWTPITTGLENSGFYTWQIDQRAAGQMYLRMEVRDEAGNVAEHVSSDPIPLSHSVPSVYVRDVHPFARSSGVSPRRYYFR